MVNASRRNLIVIVSAVARIAVVVILLRYFRLRPTKASSNRSTCGSGKHRNSEVSDGATVAHPDEARTG